ncbi:GLPGLI family protein [Halpernia sp.]|uniref:GLPGLI family protein n=1 Tax=Halpernia sp. TaxID=2782209 RepID=UPI003A8DDCC9
MQKIGFIFIFLFCHSLAYSQRKINSKIRVLYILNALNSKKPNSKKLNKTFVLVASENKSVFLTANAYTLDSLKLENKNFQELSQYFEMHYQYQVFIDKNNINFSDSILGTEIGYKETNEMNWSLINEYKEILGMKCQKATISKYGRKWIAYFSNNYPFSFGPYKFNGLPGLILEVQDSDNEYNFTAVEVKTYTKEYPISRFTNVKEVPKKDFLKIKDNLESDFTLGGKIKYTLEFTKSLVDKYEEDKKYENSIEKRE